MNSATRNILLGLGASILLAAGAAWAQTGQPPALACIGNPDCTGPIWRQIRYDCVTGDHWNRSGGCSWLPSSSCKQPDVVNSESGSAVRCDDWDEDFYERPFDSGSSGSFYHQLDVVYALASQDDNWYYFLIQMYGLTSGKLDAFYDIEIDAEPEILASPNCGTGKDDRPCPDTTTPVEGVSCIDWLMRARSPTANVKEKVGSNRWGQEGVTAFYDWNETAGGPNCAKSDYAAVNGSMNGYELLVDDQGNGGTWNDGLWAMMPSDCGAMAPPGYQDDLLGLDPSQVGLINFNSTCVVFAVRKSMVAAYLTRPITPRSSNPTLPPDYELAWRGWANKGEQDNQNLPLHDKYNNSQIGDAYRDEPRWPTQKALLDSTARLGGLHLFPPEEACPPEEQAVAQLQSFGQFQTFTSAVTPIGQTESRDSLFLSSLLPVEGVSRWPGQVRHFIQPLPVVEEDVDGDGTDDFVPDIDALCADADDVGCLEWEAHEEILAQAPNATEVTSDRKVGALASERRVLYTQGPSFSPNTSLGVPRASRELDYPFPDDAAAIDLAEGFLIPFDSSNSTQVAQAKTQAESIIRATLVERSVADPEDSTQNIVYVLGDGFQAEPLQVGGPANFNYLANDLGGNGRSCDDTVNPNRGYRCFFERHRFRRKVLLVPSNDGQLHAFDAGNFRGSVVDDRLNGDFDRGTGRELFSYIPREMLKHTAEMTTLDHDYGIDATPVVEDFFLDVSHSGIPSANEREWRTLALGGFGRGGRGYYALDLTQPDHLDVHTVLNVAGVSDVAFAPDDGGDYVPSCNKSYSSAACGALPYPSVLWEFDDSCGGAPCDDDLNGTRDLAYTWSRPNTGRVRIRVGSDTEIRYVAVFGGGFDPEFASTSGNFLYMVDVETGRVLLKRAVLGGVAAEPAAVDLDGDTFIDTVYFGTVAGHLYKLDVSTAAVYDTAADRVAATEWIPFRIFDTGGRAIFVAPTVVFVGTSGHFAVTFGTGDLHDLFGEQASAGRYYMLLDDGFTATTTGLPFDESRYPHVRLQDVATDSALLFNPTGTNLAGWVLELDATEKVVSDTTAISGLLTFTTFVTDVAAATSGPTDPQTGQACFEEVVGTGRIYRVSAINANPLVGDDRFIEVQGFASAPFVVPSGFSQQSAVGNSPNPFATSEMQDLRQDLMGMFPANCRFGNFSMRLSVNVSTGEQIPLAEIPQCVVTKNWKEF